MVVPVLTASISVSSYETSLIDSEVLVLLVSSILFYSYAFLPPLLGVPSHHFKKLDESFAQLYS